MHMLTPTCSFVRYINVIIAMAKLDSMELRKKSLSFVYRFASCSTNPFMLSPT